MSAFGFLKSAGSAIVNAAETAWAYTLFAVSKLIPGAIRMMSPRVFAKLSPSVLGTFSADQSAQISLAQLNVLNRQQVCSFSASAVGALRGEVIKGYVHLDWFPALSMLTSNQVSQLTSAQFVKLSKNQIQTLNPLGLTLPQLAYKDVTGQGVLQDLLAAQIAKLSVEVISGLTLNQISSKGNNGQMILQDLTANQIAQLSTDVVSMMSLAQLLLKDISGNQVLQYLSATQVGALTSTQFAGLSTLEIQKLDATGLKLPQLAYKDFIGQSVLQDLLVAQIAKLSVEVISGLTLGQISSKDNNGQMILQDLTANQIAQLSTDVVSMMSVAQLLLKDISGNQVLQYLSATQVGALVSTQFNGLTTQETTKLNAAGLTAEQLKYANVSGLTVLQALSLIQIQRLSNVIVAVLTPDQLTEIVASISPTQADVITATQIKGLTPIAFAKFSGDALASLCGPTVAAISAEQVSQLSSSAQIKHFIANRGMFLSATAGMGLTAQQIKSLSGLEFAQISLDALRFMLPQTLQAISGAQLSSLRQSVQCTIFGSNFKYISANALKSLSWSTWEEMAQIQIDSITNAALLEIENDIAKGNYFLPHEAIIRLSPSSVLGVSFLINCLSADETVKLIKNLSISQDTSKDLAIIKVLNTATDEAMHNLVNDKIIFNNLSARVQLHIALVLGPKELSNDQMISTNKSLSSGMSSQFGLLANSNQMQSYIATPLTVKNLIVLDNVGKEMYGYFQSVGKLEDKLSQLDLQLFTQWKQSWTLELSKLEYSLSSSSGLSSQKINSIKNSISILKRDLEVLDVKNQNTITLGRVTSLLATFTNGLLVIANNENLKLDTRGLLSTFGLLANGCLPLIQSLMQQTVNVKFEDTVVGKLGSVGYSTKASSRFAVLSYWNVRGATVPNVKNTDLTAVKALRAQTLCSLAVNVFNLSAAIYGLKLDVEAKDDASASGLTFTGSSLIFLSNSADLALSSYNVAKSTGKVATFSQISKMFNVAGCLLSVAANMTKLGMSFAKIEYSNMSSREQTLMKGYIGTVIALNAIEFVATLVNPVIGGIASIFTSILQGFLGGIIQLIAKTYQDEEFARKFDNVRQKYREQQEQWMQNLSKAGYLNGKDYCLSKFLLDADKVIPDMHKLNYGSLKNNAMFNGLVYWFSEQTALPNARNNFYIQFVNENYDDYKTYTEWRGRDSQAAITKGWRHLTLEAEYGGIDSRTAIQAVTGFLSYRVDLLNNRQLIQAKNFFNAVVPSDQKDVLYFYSDNYDVSGDGNVASDTAFQKFIRAGMKLNLNIYEEIYSLTNTELYHTRMTYAYDPVKGTYQSMPLLKSGEQYKVSVKNAVCYVLSQQRVPTTTSSYDFIFNAPSTDSTSATKFETFYGRRDFWADNVTYVIGENSVRWIVDNHIDGQVTFLDYGLDPYSQRDIFATWSAMYKTCSFTDTDIYIPPDKKSPYNVMRLLTHVVVNSVSDENFDWRSGWGYSIEEKYCAYNVVNLHKVGLIAGPQGKIDAVTNKYTQNLILSILIGAKNIASDSQTDQLYSFTNLTMLVAGYNSILHGSGGTLIGSNTSSTLFSIEGGNVDVYGFHDDEIYNSVSFQSYIAKNKSIKLVDKALQDKDRLNAYRNYLTRLFDFQFDDSAHANVSADYEVKVDGKVQSSGTIYNSSLYKFGDCDANIHLQSDGAAILFQDTVAGLRGARRYVRDITLDGNSNALVLGYGVNTVNISGLGSSITFSNVLAGDTGMVTDSTALSSDYKITYNATFDNINELANSALASNLDLSGATGVVSIDDKKTKNTILNLTLQSRDNKNINIADVSLKQSARSYYVINDYIVTMQQMSQRMEISLDPNVDGYHTIFNIYSDLSDLAASTLSVKNFGSNGFDLCIDNTDWVNFDFNSQFNMGSGVTFSNDANVGKILINLQGVDTNSHAVTTRSVSLVF